MQSDETDGPLDGVPVDLSSLRLNGTTQNVLGHLLAHGEMSVGALASATEMAPRLVSRALRALEHRGLVRHGSGRSARAGIAPRAGTVLRLEAAQLRATSARRAGELDQLAQVVDRAAGGDVDLRAPYWLVPLSLDGPGLEDEVRRASLRYDVCVPRGQRPRGAPATRRPGARLSWRLLVTSADQVPSWVPPRVRLEARVGGVDMPFLEVLDGSTCCVDVVVAGRRRRAWCRHASQVALAAAGFERWWEMSTPL